MVNGSTKPSALLFQFLINLIEDLSAHEKLRALSGLEARTSRLQPTGLSEGNLKVIQCYLFLKDLSFSLHYALVSKHLAGVPGVHIQDNMKTLSTVPVPAGDSRDGQSTGARPWSCAGHPGRWGGSLTALTAKTGSYSATCQSAGPRMKGDELNTYPTQAATRSVLPGYYS